MREVRENGFPSDEHTNGLSFPSDKVSSKCLSVGDWIDF